MQVRLVATTAVDAKVSELAAAVCVGREYRSYLVDYHQKRNDEALAKGLRVAVDSGHLGVLEHVSFTWLAQGVSRALTHQLVRHRIASYDQQSQRYCHINTSEDWYVVPPSIEKLTPKQKEEYYKAMHCIGLAYRRLLELDVPNEDARMVLPNACKSTILITMNGRAFIEAAEKRICNRAQWEIRELFIAMRNSIKTINPIVYVSS